MADMHRKGILDTELSFLRIPGIYQFNAIPDNHGADKTMWYMQTTYNTLFS
jgi:hypothetical protein